MALTLGTNCGFVATAPTADPAGTITQVDTQSRVLKATSPSTAIKITEIGWWHSPASQEANFEVGLYAADGAVVPGEAGTLLEVSRTNAKGTTAGWIVVTGLNWTISSNTVYWIAVQVDDTASISYIDYATTGGNGYDVLSSQTTLPDPFNGGTLTSASGLLSIYAVWEAAAAEKVNRGINISDAWKQISELYINIGDVWKTISEFYINQGDVWKPVGA